MVTKLGKDGVDWCLCNALMFGLAEDLFWRLIKARLNQIVDQPLRRVELSLEGRIDLGKRVHVRRCVSGPDERRKSKCLSLHW